MISTTSAPTRVLLALASLATVAASCSGDAGADKVGGQGDAEPVTLVMANANHEVPEQLVAFADEVGQRSGGSLTIEFRSEWQLGEVDFEARTIEDVRAGEVDMAWVGARVFDEVGVNSFQPLVAPMLIDSHALQEAVFEAGIPAEMLTGLEASDLVGIGVLPGPMRKVLGIDHPFLAPEDFEGAVVGIQQSAVADQAMAALGATTLDLPSGASLGGVDAYEQQSASIASNAYWRVADYVTANLNLWPRPLVMFLNASAFNSLSEIQQDAVRDAAAAAIPGALDASRAEVGAGSAEICGSEMTTVVASADDLAALDAAFEPVYAALAEDAAVAEHLDAIAALKNELDVAPDGAECPPSAAATPATVPAAFDEPTAIDGAWEVTTAESVWDCSGPACWGHIVWMFDRGGFVMTLENDEVCTWAYGTYEVLGDRFAMTFIDGGGSDPLQANRPGEYFVFGWQLENDLLTLSPVSGEVSPDPALGEPWQRASAASPAGALSSSCPPPPEALPDPGTEEAAEVAAGFPEGHFETTITSEDWEGSEIADVPGTFTMVVDSGVLTILQPDTEEVGFEGEYTVFNDRIEVSDGPDTVTAVWAFDGERLTFSDVEPAGTPFEVVWESHPWQLVGDRSGPAPAGIEVPR